MTLKEKRNRTQSANQVRADAAEVIDKAMAGSDASPAAKASRREKLTKFPPAVRAARDQNDARDPSDGQRVDERPPGKPL